MGEAEAASRKIARAMTAVGFAPIACRFIRLSRLQRSAWSTSVSYGLEVMLASHDAVSGSSQRLTRLLPTPADDAKRRKGSAKKTNRGGLGHGGGRVEIYRYRRVGRLIKATVNADYIFGGRSKADVAYFGCVQADSDE